MQYRTVRAYARRPATMVSLRRSVRKNRDTINFSFRFQPIIDMIPVGVAAFAITCIRLLTDQAVTQIRVKLTGAAFGEGCFGFDREFLRRCD